MPRGRNPKRYMGADGTLSRSTKRKRQWGEPATRERFYSKKPWKQLRRSHLAANPTCAECERKGRFREATLVDHIIPRADAPERELDPTNLQSLCVLCHDAKTAKENRERQLQRMIENKESDWMNQFEYA